MAKRRGGVGVATWNGFLYAIGGHDAPASSLASRLSDCVERWGVKCHTGGCILISFIVLGSTCMHVLYTNRSVFSGLHRVLCYISHFSVGLIKHTVLKKNIFNIPHHVSWNFVSTYVLFCVCYIKCMSCTGNGVEMVFLWCVCDEWIRVSFWLMIKWPVCLLFVRERERDRRSGHGVAILLLMWSNYAFMYFASLFYTSQHSEIIVLSSVNITSNEIFN